MGSRLIAPRAGARIVMPPMIRSVSLTSKVALSRFWRALATSAVADARSAPTFVSSSLTCYGTLLYDIETLTVAQRRTDLLLEISAS